MAMSHYERYLAELAATALRSAPPPTERQSLFASALENARRHLLEETREAYFQRALAYLMEAAAAWYHQGRAPELKAMLEAIVGEPGDEEGEIVIPAPAGARFMASHRADAERLIRAMAEKLEEEKSSEVSGGADRD